MKILRKISATVITTIILVSSMFGGNLFADTSNSNDWESIDMVAAVEANPIISFSVARNATYVTANYRCLTDHPYVSFYNCTGGAAHVTVFVGTSQKATFTIPVTGTTTINVPFSANYGDSVHFEITAVSSATSGSFTLHRGNG